MKCRTEAIAYDYHTQTFVRGGEAVRVRQNQLMEEIALIRGAGGDEYARFVGCDKAALLDSRVTELEQLSCFV